MPAVRSVLFSRMQAHIIPLKNGLLHLHSRAAVASLKRFTHKSGRIHTQIPCYTEPFLGSGVGKQLVFSSISAAQTARRKMVPYFPVLSWGKKVLATNVRLTLLSSVQVFPSFRPQTLEMGLVFLSLLFENLRQQFRHTNVRTS